jgi:hypothetical protein
MRSHHGVGTILGPMARRRVASGLGEPLSAKVRSLSVLGAALRCNRLTPPQVVGL